MGRRSRHERRRPCYRLLRQPSRSHSILHKSHGNSRRIFSIMSQPPLFLSLSRELPKSKPFEPTSYAFGSYDKIFYKFKQNGLQPYPARLPKSYHLEEFIPNPYRFKEFIPAARKPGSLQNTIHITHQHTLEHPHFCREHYCPYHRQ